MDIVELSTGHVHRLIIMNVSLVTEIVFSNIIISKALPLLL